MNRARSPERVLTPLRHALGGKAGNEAVAQALQRGDAASVRGHLSVRGGQGRRLLRAHPGADLRAPAPDEESVQGAVRLVQLRRVSKVVDDYKHLAQFLHLQLL